MPDIPGIEREGVYTLRNLNDALNLMARRARSHHTIVIGGGLLGLETARGMQPMNTRVTIVEHSDRLMASQLDERSGKLLRENIESMGFDVIISDGIKEVIGTPRVSGVLLNSGRVINCDTVVVATGIRPHIELARQAGLAYGRGITVDDRMRSSHPDIYAVGECAEHRGNVYGLVAPGYEQAGVAASDITGQPKQLLRLCYRLKAQGYRQGSIQCWSSGLHSQSYGWHVACIRGCKIGNLSKAVN